MRSNGCPPEVIVLQNESEAVELEAVISEVESFEEESGISIDSDVIDDQVMADLIEFLNTNRLLNLPVK
jgi:hypothetical protein